jgi:hypothetical protein
MSFLLLALRVLLLSPIYSWHLQIAGVKTLPALKVLQHQLILLPAAHCIAHVQRTRRRRLNNKPIKDEELTRRRKTRHIPRAATIQAGDRSQGGSESSKGQLKPITIAVPQVTCGSTGNHRISFLSKSSSQPPKFLITATFRTLVRHTV